MKDGEIVVVKMKGDGILMLELVHLMKIVVDGDNLLLILIITFKDLETIILILEDGEVQILIITLEGDGNLIQMRLDDII
jgi:hypothetical protein